MRASVRQSNTLNYNLIRRLIEKGGISRMQIAKDYGISRSSLDNIVAGSDVRVSTLEMLAKALGVPMYKLFLTDEELAEMEGTKADGPNGIHARTVLKELHGVNKLYVDSLVQEDGDGSKSENTQIKEEEKKLRSKNKELAKMYKQLQTDYNKIETEFLVASTRIDKLEEEKRKLEQERNKLKDQLLEAKDQLIHHISSQKK